MSATGSFGGEIRDCQRIYDRSGNLLARRDSSGRYYLANGSLLGRFEMTGHFYAANGRLALRISNGALYNAAGVLVARYR